MVEESVAPDGALEYGATSSRLVAGQFPQGIVEATGLVASDVFALVFSFAFGHWLAGASLFVTTALDFDSLLADRRVLFSFAATGFVLGMLVKGRYSKRTPFWEETRQATNALCLAALANSAMLFLSNATFARYGFLITWAFAIALVPVLRVGTKAILMRSGLWHRPTIIIGTGKNAQTACQALKSDWLSGYRIEAFAAVGDIRDEVEYQPQSKMAPIVRFAKIDDLIAATPPETQFVVALDSLQGQHALVRLLNLRSRNVQVVPSLRGLPLHGTEMSHFIGYDVLMLRVRDNLGRKGLSRVKRLFDLAVALVIILTLIPLLTLITVVLLAEGASPFFGHRRIGRYGMTFRCWKFRTMVPDAENVLRSLLERDQRAREEWECTHKLKDDPRVTKFGAFLRRTSLDELPQLWNVLCGQMSLVGPRPVVNGELERYGEMRDYYLTARPGLTGLWQVSGRNDVDYSDRVALDVWYVRNWSPWYDLIILLKTVRVVLQRTGAY